MRLPLGGRALLRGLGTPLGGSGSGGVPALSSGGGSVTPVGASSASKTGGGSFPVTTRGKAGLDGGDACVLDSGKLLLLDLLLGLGLRVAVYLLFFWLVFGALLEED